MHGLLLLSLQVRRLCACSWHSCSLSSRRCSRSWWPPGQRLLPVAEPRLLAGGSELPGCQLWMVLVVARAQGR